jgi:hypothetical protein
MVGVLGVVGALTGAYVALAAGLYAGQRRILFPRASAPPDPAVAAALGMRHVGIPGHDGLRLSHWYRPAAPGAATMVAFHGNAGTIEARADKLRSVLAAGFGLLLVEYRGYGGNPGRPDEPAVLADARSVLDWLAGQGVPPERTAVYGESLGTAVAVAMAAERAVGAVVLDAPFTSVAELAQAHYWYVPAKWLVTDRFDSAARIGAVTAPKLFLHGERDPVVPIRFGRRLHALAPEPKQQWIAPRGQHVDLFEHGADRVVVEFLTAWLPVARSAAAHAPAPPERRA